MGDRFYAGDRIMAEYKPGSMDISDHKKTFGGFIKAGIWTCVVVAIVLVFLAIVGT